MATTLQQTEGEPTALPPATEPADGPGETDFAAWARIEDWCSVRWIPRTVEWIVEGPGEWVPPLTPATVATVEAWDGTAYEAVSFAPSPMRGLILPNCVTYRITATVGAGEVPAAAIAAYTRLSAYMRDARDQPAGASDHSVNIGGALSETYNRDPRWLAKAMQYSGAADLLRPYRRMR